MTELVTMCPQPRSRAFMLSLFSPFCIAQGTVPPQWADLRTPTKLTKATPSSCPEGIPSLGIPDITTLTAESNLHTRPGQLILSLALISVLGLGYECEPAAPPVTPSSSRADSIDVAKETNVPFLTRPPHLSPRSSSVHKDNLPLNTGGCFWPTDMSLLC